MDVGARLDARIDGLRGDVVGLLSELVAIDSTVAVGASAANDLLELRYRRAGLETARVAADNGPSNLVGSYPGRGGGRSLALNAHVDTPTPVDADAWTLGPWQPREVDGSVFGLGTAEGKSSAAVMWAVAQALHDEHTALAGDLQLHSVTSWPEAAPGAGTAVVLDAGYLTEGAIVLTPTGYPHALTVAPIAAGAAALTVHVLGKVTHCGNRPRAIRPGGQGDTIGVNALEKGMHVVAAFADLEDRWGITKSHPDFTPGFFTIGVTDFWSDAGFPFPAYFPDQARIRFAVTYPPGEDGDDILSEIETYLRRACALDPWLDAHPATLEWEAVSPPMETSATHDLTRSLLEGRAAADSNSRSSVGAATAALVGSCDGPLYQARGIPAIAFGPGDPLAARRIDEHVEIEHVIDAAKALARTVVAWCGGSPS